MNDKKYYLSFDAESDGLMGKAFAVGWVIVDQANNELEQGYLGCPRSFSRVTDQWVIENVLPVLPRSNCPDRQSMLIDFWDAWTKAKQDYPGITMVTDGPFPVEAGFLLEVVREYRPQITMQDSPYPIIDLMSCRAAAGYDPLATCDRLPSEEPCHHPTNDARQSVRLLLALQDELAGNRSLGFSHGLYGSLVNPDGTEWVPDPPTFTTVHDADWSGPTGHHITYTYGGNKDPNG